MFYQGISPPKKKLSFTNGPTKEKKIPKFLQKGPNTNKNKFYNGIRPPKKSPVLQKSPPKKKKNLSWAHEKKEGKKKKGNDSAGDRTQNLWFRRPAPYPLGHGVILLRVGFEPTPFRTRTLIWRLRPTRPSQLLLL